MSIVIDEMIDFIASGPSASAVAEWRPSEQARLASSGCFLPNETGGSVKTMRKTCDIP